MSDSESSSSSSSSSSAEIHEEQQQVPDNCVLIKYPNLDPSEFLQNPILVDASCLKKLSEPVNEHVSANLLELVKSFTEITHMTLALNLKIIEGRINKKLLKNSDIYGIVDAMYMSVPDCFFIDAMSLGDMLPLLNQKLAAHKQCLEVLTGLQKLCKHDSDEELEISLPASPATPKRVQPRRPKNKKRKKKGGNNSGVVVNEDEEVMEK